MTQFCNLPLPKGHSLIPEDGRNNRQYKLESVLGKGGFAYVYKAYDPLHNRLVAIKELFPEDYVQRNKSNYKVQAKEGYTGFYKKLKDNFANEATNVTRVNNEHVVRIIDTFTAHNTFYFVMPYLQGNPLDKYIGKLMVNQVKHLLYCSIEGLSAIHNAGYVHRDITPGNIFITDSLSPIIIDLGSARHASNNNMTQILTPTFAAPEQFNKEATNIKAVSDIYGMAASFYYVITGNKPQQQSAHHLYKSLSSSHLGSKLGSSFLQVFCSALEIEASKRPSSAGQWLENLKKASIQSPNHQFEREKSKQPKGKTKPQQRKKIKRRKKPQTFAFILGDPALTILVIILTLLFFIAIIS